MRVLIVFVPALLAACDKPPPPAGGPEDRSAQGEAIRRADAVVAAAQGEAARATVVARTSGATAEPSDAVPVGEAIPGQ